MTSTLQFELAPDLEATAPAEVAGHGRDDVRLMVSEGVKPPRHLRFAELATVLEPGDLLVFNTSATVAAVSAQRPDGETIDLHLSLCCPTACGSSSPVRPH